MCGKSAHRSKGWQAAPLQQRQAACSHVYDYNTQHINGSMPMCAVESALYSITVFRPTVTDSQISGCVSGGKACFDMPQTSEKASAVFALWFLPLDWSGVLTNKQHMGLSGAYLHTRCRDCRDDLLICLEEALLASARSLSVSCFMMSALSYVPSGKFTG